MFWNGPNMAMSRLSSDFQSAISMLDLGLQAAFLFIRRASRLDLCAGIPSVNLLD